ncbi:MAG: O-antigen ligase family protein [Vicinamibacterales bacterium]
MLALLVWGVLAFGAVYPWAYTPLLAGCAAVGLAAIVQNRRLGQPDDYPLLTRAWLLLSAAVVLQIIPLPPRVLAALSPAAPAFLESYDLGYLAAGLPQADTVAPANTVSLFRASWHALSISPSSTAVGLLFLAVLGLFLLGLTHAFSRGGLSRLVRGVIVLASVVAFVGIAQLSIIGDEAYTGMKIYGVWQPENLLVTPFGPFVNKNHFAGWMLMALPLALGYMCSMLEDARLLRARSLRDRVLWFSTPQGGQLLLVGLASVLMAFSLLMTRSRSGLISLAVAMVVAGGAAVRAFRGGLARATVVTALVVLFVVPMLWLGPDVALGRLLGGQEGYLKTRLDAWQSALRILADFPLAGTGLNTFGVATVLYQVGGGGLHFAQAHNDYLQVAAEGGLLVGVPALLFVAAVAMSIARRVRCGEDDPASRWLRTGAIAGIIGMLVQSLVEFSLQMPGNAVLFVVLLAAAMHVSPAARAARCQPDRILARPH